MSAFPLIHRHLLSRSALPAALVALTLFATLWCSHPRHIHREIPLVFAAAWFSARPRTAWIGSWGLTGALAFRLARDLAPGLRGGAADLGLVRS